MIYVCFKVKNLKKENMLILRTVKTKITIINVKIKNKTIIRDRGEGGNIWAKECDVTNIMGTHRER